MNAEKRLRDLNIVLPSAPKALGLYRPIIVVNHLAYLSGHGPLLEDGTAVCGRLGDGLSADDGHAAARRTALVILSTLKDGLGSLDRVSQLIKTTGYVNSTPDFANHPAVINGFSEVMQDVFGKDFGTGARSALGVATLPAGWAVEIEAIFEVATD